LLTQKTQNIARVLIDSIVLMGNGSLKAIESKDNLTESKKEVLSFRKTIDQL